ncbi:hypothetical protein ACP70R_012266 [Stipagrostis hirtigluma subsp. patula]
MEPLIAARVLPPLPATPRRLLLALAAPRGFASISVPSSFGGSGGEGRIFAGGGGGGGGGGGDGNGSGDDSGAGAAAAAAAAAAALGETEAADGDTDFIVLHVGGMSCGGCAGKVKLILESQPEVAAATVDFEKAIAVVWATPEAKEMKDWQKQLGDKLANHLTTCGFQSHLQESEAENKATFDSNNECP